MGAKPAPDQVHDRCPHRLEVNGADDLVNRVGQRYTGRILRARGVRVIHGRFWGYVSLMRRISSY